LSVGYTDLVSPSHLRDKHYGESVSYVLLTQFPENTLLTEVFRST